MNKGRKKKVRYVDEMPKVRLFSPRGKAGRPDEVVLKVDQFEAIRLADFLGYHHEKGAKAMGISRATFGRILEDGRKLVADALINGKIIKIGIGDVQVGARRLKPHKIVDDSTFSPSSEEFSSIKNQQSISKESKIVKAILKTDVKGDLE